MTPELKGNGRISAVYTAALVVIYNHMMLLLSHNEKVG